jgi:hypothetical protein
VACCTWTVCSVRVTTCQFRLAPISISLVYRSRRLGQRWAYSSAKPIAGQCYECDVPAPRRYSLSLGGLDSKTRCAIVFPVFWSTIST